jgi:hypothetical protein
MALYGRYRRLSVAARQPLGHSNVPNYDEFRTESFRLEA